jgi:hypothetical protein
MVNEHWKMNDENQVFNAEEKLCLAGRRVFTTLI